MVDSVKLMIFKSVDVYKSNFKLLWVTVSTKVAHDNMFRKSV